MPDAPPARRPAPVAQDQPRSRRPTAEQAPSRPKPTAKPPPEEPLIKAGDRICPVCGVGNDPARRFCRKCGASLEQAVVAVPVHLPWYRRLFRRGSPERYRAGERPRSMEERGRPRRSVLGILLPLAVLVAIVAAVGAYVAVPDVQRQVNETIGGLRRQLMPDLEDVTPVANSTNVRNVIDRNKATWWEGDGDQPSIRLRFAPAVDLGAMIITNGANGDDFPRFRRPSRIRLTAEGGSSVTLDIEDATEFRAHRIDLRDVSQLRVQVLETRGPADAPVAIRDLEFQELR
ncbi:MAG: hypothetical protein ABWZ82_00210 [Candidatus Limnocylindrales bacterium]